MTKPVPVLQKPRTPMDCNSYDGSHGEKSSCEVSSDDYSKSVANCVCCDVPLIQFSNGGWYKLDQIELKDNQKPEWE